MPPCILASSPLSPTFCFLSSMFPPLLLDPSLFLFTTLCCDSIYFDIYLPFIPFLHSHPSSYLLPVCLLCLLPSTPLLAPSHLRHTHLALPFIASGGWRATVSFNPRQCHLQTLTVTERLHRCLTIKAMALSKAGRGVITAAAQQIEPPFDMT